VGKTALIIDDNDNNLLLERDLLELAGFQVFVAETGSLGIRLAVEKQPDIILMDMRLPDMRGSAAARLLLDMPATQNIPIVFVTCSVLAEGLEEVRDIPNAAFIGKPVNTRTFATNVGRFLKGPG
jgi:CheY-like chemotaxis protein